MPNARFLKRESLNSDVQVNKYEHVQGWGPGDSLCGEKGGGWGASEQNLAGPWVMTVMYVQFHYSQNNAMEMDRPVSLKKLT